jgi:hypothetical protein
MGLTMTSPDRAAALIRARTLLAGFLEQGAQDMTVMANFSRQQHLAELGRRLLERMESAEGYPNKAYNGLAEAIARCLALYADAPDRYAQLIRGICDDDMDVFLDAFSGIWRLDTLVSGLADDHDYVFNEQTMTIEIAGPENRHALGLTPVRFLALVVAAEKGVPPVGQFSR